MNDKLESIGVEKIVLNNSLACLAPYKYVGNSIDLGYSWAKYPFQTARFYLKSVVTLT